MMELSQLDVGAVAAVAVEALRCEYPNDLLHPMRGPEDRPFPHELHPAFYGCYDWHSAVEMHWALLRLLRVMPEHVPAVDVRAVLDEHLAAERIEVEAAYFETHRGFKRPYGWGWALMLAHEAANYDDPDGARWAASVAPLAEILTERFLEWLAKATYPERDGMHNNSAFGLSRALPYAQAAAASGRPALLESIAAAAKRWFAGDVDCPARWEPSGSDFLSPSLTEAELMARLLAPDAFAAWLDRFLPGLADQEPRAIFTPAVVSDPSDGLIAHLHGLNLSRAYCWTRIADALPADDPRVAGMRHAARRHAQASLKHVTGGEYMLEHWLGCYAILLLT
jgi:hypothetical protein